MVVEFSCPQCQARYRGDERCLGKSLKCKKCGCMISIPADLRVKENAAPAAPAAVAKWYYNVSDEAQLGPITEKEIGTLIKSGVIKNDTLLWCHELAEWTELEGINNPEWKACLPPPPLPRRVVAPGLQNQNSSTATAIAPEIETTLKTDDLPGPQKVTCPICHKKVEPVRIYRDKDIVRCPMCGYTGSDLKISTMEISQSSNNCKDQPASGARRKFPRFIFWLIVMGAILVLFYIIFALWGLYDTYDLPI